MKNKTKTIKNYSKTIPITPTPAVIIVRVCRQPYRISDIQSLMWAYNSCKIDTSKCCATGIWDTIQYAINYINTNME